MVDAITIDQTARLTLGVEGWLVSCVQSIAAHAAQSSQRQGGLRGIKSAMGLNEQERKSVTAAECLEAP